MQEEADTKLILHSRHIAANSSDNTAIVIRSPDNDVFILLLSSMHDVRQALLFDTGTSESDLL